MSDGFPKLVTVRENPRIGLMAFFEDGMIATFDYTLGIWRPATAHLSYEALFCTTTKTYTRATDTLNLELAPDIAVED